MLWKIWKTEQLGDISGLFPNIRVHYCTNHNVAYRLLCWLDVTGVYIAANTSIGALDSARNEDNVDAQHDAWYDEALTFAQKFGIPESKPQYAGKQTQRVNYQTDSAVELYTDHLPRRLRTIPYPYLTEQPKESKKHKKKTKSLERISSIGFDSLPVQSSKTAQPPRVRLKKFILVKYSHFRVCEIKSLGIF